MNVSFNDMGSSFNDAHRINLMTNLKIKIHSKIFFLTIRNSESFSELPDELNGIQNYYSKCLVRAHFEPILLNSGSSIAF